MRTSRWQRRCRPKAASPPPIEYKATPAGRGALARALGAAAANRGGRHVLECESDSTAWIEVAHARGTDVITIAQYAAPGEALAGAR